MTIWLVGAGTMAQGYANVLRSLDKNFEVIGRGSKSAERFELATGFVVKRGGLRYVLADTVAPRQAIVAVGVEQLAETTIDLINAGTRRILVEKPGGMNTDQVRQIVEAAAAHHAVVNVAYNRRFYASTARARELILEDGGATSCAFEFTEWSHVIGPMKLVPAVKEAWFLANSTHVVDLAFHLCGFPKDWHAWHGGALNWHPSAARFCGAGVTEQGIFFSYHADWEAPGRWGVEVLTRKRRLIFRPMEQLQVVPLGSVKIDQIEIDDHVDRQFKPGLLGQVKAFLSKDDRFLCTIQQQLQHCAVYDEMAGYCLPGSMPRMAAM